MPSISFIKIIAILIVAIALGILVVSNFALLIPVVVFGQPTVALPMGVWLLLAIVLGFLLGILIQGLLYFQRRSLVKRLRQLQQRLNYEEEVFTYTPPSKSGDRQVRNSSGDEVDDWDVPRIPVDRMEWEESGSASRSTTSNSYDEDRRERFTTRDNFADDQFASPSNYREEVYDADFKLIQPPYKQPLDEPLNEDLDPTIEDFDPEPDRDFPLPDEREFESRDRVSYDRDRDGDDWGFDFDQDEDFERRGRR